MPDPHRVARIELLDFNSDTPPARLAYTERIVQGDVGISSTLVRPNPGTLLGAAQFVVAIHEGAPAEMEWRRADQRQIERRRLAAGDIHLGPADKPIFLRWSGLMRVLVFAMEQTFVRQVVSQAFDGRELSLRAMMGIRDPVIDAMAAVWRRELAGHGAGSRLYLEALGAALSVHIFRTYGDRPIRPPSARGGLGPQRLRRVVDYIEAHLEQDISLSDLAAVAGLSRHHFGEAFKISTGTSPHRHLIERRIHRAKELLLGTGQTLAEIALAVGFASHSHFTDSFRKLTGTTPSRFRRNHAGTQNQP